MRISLRDFWALAARHGLVPIIADPVKGANFDKPYQAMAASAIVGVGVQVDKFAHGQDAAYVQSGLIRLRQTIGNMDGAIGKKSRDGLTALGIGIGSIEEMVRGIDHALQAKFPGEVFDSVPSGPDAIR